MNESNGHDRFLSADEILAFDDIEIVPFYIPEWKSMVRFRVMPANIAMRFQSDLENPAKKNDAWIKIFALCAVNENGSRMFSDQQLEKLRTKSTKVFMRMQTELLRLNGFTKEDKEKVKNDFGEEVSDDSLTDSPRS